MNHKASIYSNPVIPAGLYFCKLLDLHLDTSDRPFLWSNFVTGPAYGEHSDIKLASIIYRTPKSEEELITKFKAMFRISAADDLESYLGALGRWGCVSISVHDYHSTQFSCLSFVRQNAQMQFTSSSLEKREQMGEKAWFDRMMAER